MMNTAYQFRIYPTNGQKELMAKTFGCVRFIYNRMLSDRIEYYEKTKKQLNNTPAQYKDEFPFLKEVDSLALANAQVNLNKAYSSFFRQKENGFPGFKNKKSHQSYTTNLVNNNISLCDGFLRLPKLGSIKIRQHRDIPEGYRLKSVTVSRNAASEYHASILYEQEEEIKEIKLEEIKEDRILGIDFSMKELAVFSDGKSAGYPGYYRKSKEQLAREQRRLSKCRKGSRNREKQRLKVAKLHEKVSRQRKDFQHKLSRQITNDYEVVCVETLSMKGMSQALNYGKSVHDNGFGMFVSFLEYKLKREGKKLIRVDRWYASSKTCSRCGRVKKELHLSERIYQCECGNRMDRDVNAAINIREEGKRLLTG
ncbi:MAG: transposase [Herbinix sp.]|nr:transposase [Herbinix sp.]